MAGAGKAPEHGAAASCSGAGHLGCAVGLSIPQRVARLQSPPPLPQARKHSMTFMTSATSAKNTGDDVRVASRTGPGDRHRSGWLARSPRVRRVVPVQASADRQWANTDSGASAALRLAGHAADTDRRRSRQSAQLRPQTPNEAASPYERTRRHRPRRPTTK